MPSTVIFQKDGVGVFKAASLYVNHDEEEIRKSLPASYPKHLRICVAKNAEPPVLSHTRTHNINWPTLHFAEDHADVHPENSQNDQIRRCADGEDNDD